MSFEVKIGVCKDAKNKVSKSPSWNYTLSGQLKDSCDILNPTIRLIIGDSKDIKLPTITKCNYMYIDNFNRYYFITGFNIVRNTVLEVTGHVDVLNTYKDQIKANTGLILRSESNYSKFLDDGAFKIFSNPYVVTKKLTGESFAKNPSFILAVSGGGKKSP